MPEVLDARDHTVPYQLVTSGLDPNKMSIVMQSDAGEQILFEANLGDDPLKAVQSNIAAAIAWSQKKREDERAEEKKQLDVERAENKKRLDEANAEIERLRQKEAEESANLEKKRKRQKGDVGEDTFERGMSDDLLLSESSSMMLSSPLSSTVSQSSRSSTTSSSPAPSSATDMSDHESTKIKIEPNMHKNAFNRLMKNASRQEQGNRLQNGSSMGSANVVDLTQDDSYYHENADRYVLQTKRHAGVWIGSEEVSLQYLKGMYGDENTLRNNEGLREAIEWRFRRDHEQLKKFRGPRKAKYTGGRGSGYSGMAKSIYAPRNYRK